MKLLIVGLALIAAGLAALVADFNPATPFIAGVVCTFLGVIDVIARPGTGVAMSAGDMREAESLANLQVYGSADRSAQFIDRP